jgi:hypothetical protein
MKLLRILTLSLFLTPLAALAWGNNVLQDPAPIEVPAKVSADKVEKIVKQALIARDWIPKSVGAGKIEAAYSNSGHGGAYMAKIAVTYSNKEVTIKYLDSVNLKYQEKGELRTIHPNYNRWINFLVKDINTQLLTASF